MELEELKQAWAALDSKLQKNETLNEKLILEMATGKTNKAVNRLIAWDTFSLVFSIACIPVLLFMIMYRPLSSINMAITVLLAVCLVAYAVWLSFRVYWLMKFDVSGNLKDNIACINRHKLQIKRDKMIVILLIPIISIAGFVEFARLHLPLVSWITLICVDIIATIICIISFNQISDTHIAPVAAGLTQVQALKGA